MTTQSLEKLIAQATPLPWKVEEMVFAGSGKPSGAITVSGVCTSQTWENKEKDFALIAYAVNSILPMSKRCDELEKALGQLVKAGDDCVMSASLAANSYGSHLVSAVANGRTLLSQIESEK